MNPVYPFILRISQRKSLLALLLVMCLASVVQAQTTKTWSGTANANWDTPNNWLPTGLPTASDNVVIPGGTPNQPVLSSAASASTVEVQSGASLSISSGGGVTINGSKSVSVNGQILTTGFFNGGTVVNGGSLVLGNTGSVGSVGLWNVSSFSNVAGGSLQIDRSSTAGLYHASGSFVNSSSITIGSIASVETYGLYNQSSFSNVAGGSLQIDRSSTAGLFNASGSFVSSSILTIGSSVTGVAINNQAAFDNQGCGALLQSIGPGVITNAGSFSNTGTIIESSTGTSGISYNGGLVQNLNGGTFTIGSGNPAVTTAGLLWRGCVSSDWNTAGNWSLGYVPTATDDVTIPSGTANQPVLSTTAVANSVEVQGGASLNISPGASLSINGNRSFYGAATAFYNGGTVVNGGSLVVGNTGSVGRYGLMNLVSFSNVAGASIHIDRASTAGLYNFEGRSSFTNSSSVVIGANNPVGLYGLLNEGSFSNTAGGSIYIDRSTDTGLFNGDGSFVNSSSVVIGASSTVGQYGLRSFASFSNEACGALLQVVNNIIDGPNLTNTANIIESGSGNSNIAGNSGIVQNLGGGNFNITTNTGLLTTSSGLLWTGCTSSEWHTATNWLLGRVPTASDNVVIPGGRPNQPVLSTTAVARTVEVQSGASLSISSGGSLSINGSKSITFNGDAYTMALFNGGTVVNGGSLVLGKTASLGQVGLWNVSSFSNVSGGGITIDQASQYGLWNQEGSFMNSATVVIGATNSGGNYGLYNMSSFSNVSGGFISIARVDSKGLWNGTGSFVNSATVVIGLANLLNSGGGDGLYNMSSFSNVSGGLITINRASGNALWNGGGFVNSATIVIGSANVTNAGGQNGVSNSSSFSNVAGGLITINLVVSNGLLNRGGSFANAGTVEIGSANVTDAGGNTGVLNQASFSNVAGGLITIDRVRFGGQGLNNQSGSFVNSATVTIGSASGPNSGGDTGLYNTSSFSNVEGGVITIDRVGNYGLFNTTGNFTNSATVVIGSANVTKSGGDMGLYNGSSFSNVTGGVITIDRVGSWGVFNSSGSFMNSAMVVIGSTNVPNSGGDTGLFNGASFSNVVGGTITIDRCITRGLLNPSGSFVNFSSITIGAVANVGQYGLYNQSSFSNVAGGAIQIDRSSQYGLFNQLGNFVNQASISLGNSMSATAVDNQNNATFNNQGCGALLQSLGNAVITNTASFSNTGTIIESASGNSSISFNGGIIQNLNGGSFTVAQGRSPLSLSTTDPTTCNPANGSLTLTGVEPGTPYTLAYNGGNSTSTVSLTGDAGGGLRLTGLAGGSYSLTLSGACVALPLSLSATLNGPPSLSITSQPAVGSAVCAGGEVSVLVVASGAGSLNYQWYKGASQINGQTSAVLSLSGVSLNDGGSYLVVVSDNCSSTTSTAFSLTVNALPSVTVTASSTLLTCASPSLTLTATSSQTALVWSTGETTASISVSAVGNYSVTATAPNGCTTASNSLNVGQDVSLPAFTINSQTVCQGQLVSLIASGCSGQVRWSTGEAGNSLTVTAGSSTSVLTATCTVGSCSTTASGSVVVGQIQPPPAQILSLRVDESTCPVRLVGLGVGTSFVYTNSQGYVFSNVYRTGGTHDAVGLDVKQPGIYTLTVTYTNECGSSRPVSQTVTVSRTCP